MQMLINSWDDNERSASFKHLLGLPHTHTVEKVQGTKRLDVGSTELVGWAQLLFSLLKTILRSFSLLMLLLAQSTAVEIW